MTARERFLKTLNFEKPDDRLPMIEWAAWWNLTADRWKNEGFEQAYDFVESQKYFDLDPMFCIGASPRSSQFPNLGDITDEASYDKIRPFLFQDEGINALLEGVKALKEQHDKGEIIIRVWLDGFFWFPRTLFGIEGHLYAFYDYPELMHRINNDLAEFNIKVINALCKVITPDMFGFAEDMSYNHGPMISYNIFKEFLLPYYTRVIPHINKYGVKVFIDSDGDITQMVPWFMEAGIEGVYPLERQAGVDINFIREKYPKFLMLGAYDKMVMKHGESAMRAEFERILPVMRSGGYIPSIDHQTPPDVSLENYKIYARLFKEYAEKALY